MEIRCTPLQVPGACKAGLTTTVKGGIGLPGRMATAGRPRGTTLSTKHVLRAPTAVSPGAGAAMLTLQGSLTPLPLPS